MVLWSFTKIQSKIFLNLLTQTIPTAPAIFPIKFDVLEVGGGEFQVKTSTIATKTKIQKLNARFGHYSCTIHNTINDITHARRDTIHYTTQKHTGMETCTELNKTLTSQWTYTNSTTLELHIYQNTEHKHTEHFTLNETIGPRQRRQIW